MHSTTCPAGICQRTVANRDPDRMFGHLLNDHHWTFHTANNWMKDNWEPPTEPDRQA